VGKTMQCQGRLATRQKWWQLQVVARPQGENSALPGKSPPLGSRRRTVSCTAVGLFSRQKAVLNSVFNVEDKLRWFIFKHRVAMEKRLAMLES
tara:strand:- start:635 stop:913 length:279 start_codon:yes stop_codon:yes gene_type:complete